MYMLIYACIHIHNMYIYIYVFISLFVFIYIYIYVLVQYNICICICICMYTYMYIILIVASHHRGYAKAHDFGSFGQSLGCWVLGVALQVHPSKNIQLRHLTIKLIGDLFWSVWNTCYFSHIGKFIIQIFQRD